MKLKKMFIAITMSLMVFHFGSIAWAKPVKGLMMYWRGETDCAKGFRADLPNWDMRCQQRNSMPPRTRRS